MSAADDLARASAAMPEVRLTRGDCVALEPVHWVWPGFLPAGMLTILGGSPGCGKTTIALSLAATVTRGASWPDGARCDSAADVIVWSGEDPPSVSAARLVAADADMQRIHFISGVSDGEAFDPGRDMALLESTLAGLPAPRLLILDPIVSAVAGDSHKGAEVRRSLQPVVDLAQRLGCAVLGITHFTKGTNGRDPIERVTGSIAFAALARVVLVAAKVKPEPGDEGEPRRVLMRAKSNVGPDDGGFAYALERVEVKPGVEGQRVHWLEALDGTARELLAEAEGEPQTAEAASASGEAAAFLRDMLTGGGEVSSRDATQRMKTEGYSDKVIRNAREKLGVTVKRKGFGMSMQSMWSLPVVPTVAHSCPVVPTQIDGQQWASMQREGTNGAALDDIEVM
jgi:putative DNA primase/helicase